MRRRADLRWQRVVVECDLVLPLPYQSTAYLALYAGTAGKLFAHRQVVPAALAYGVWTLVAVVGSVPVWRMMGLI